jgi:hypothetical protein
VVDGHGDFLFCCDAGRFPPDKICTAGHLGTSSPNGTCPDVYMGVCPVSHVPPNVPFRGLQCPVM